MRADFFRVKHCQVLLSSVDFGLIACL
jgi:hypothetical protein